MKWEPRTHPVQWGPRSPLEHGGADMTGGVAEGPTWRAHMGRGPHDLIPKLEIAQSEQDVSPFCKESDMTYSWKRQIGLFLRQ